MRKLFALTGILMIASLVLAACGGAAAFKGLRPAVFIVNAQRQVVRIIGDAACGHLLPVGKIRRFDHVAIFIVAVIITISI